METKVQRKRRAEKYREAARMIERGQSIRPGGGTYSCIAVGAAFLTPGRSCFHTAPVRAYVETMYGPSMDNFQTAIEREDDPQGVRVLALCFMAALVETGDA